jgi:signal transduction histidine kinase
LITRRRAAVLRTVRVYRPGKPDVDTAASTIRSSRFAGVAAAATVVAVITVAIYPLRELDPGVSSGVLYVLGVLLVSMEWGLWLGLVTSVASAVALEYFHATQPSDPLAVDPADLVAIAVLLVTSIVASLIADRARLRLEDAEERLGLDEELRRRDAERIHLQEVRASRARVLKAADEERKRVVRDVHDGAQQRLVHTVVTLKLAKRALALGDRSGPELVDAALELAGRANDELRELVHGILPALLTRRGLRSAVRGLASRMPLPVGVDVPDIRFPAAIEATAYFVVAEALTNVVKHANARSAAVTATVTPDRLEVDVRDDGIGGARADGGGLLGLEDRLAARDGMLHVDSVPGAGTRIAATIPLTFQP